MPERLFYIAYGKLGEEIIRSKPGPMYTVRRGAMAVALQSAKMYERQGQRDAAVMCHEIVTAWLEAPAGDLLFGSTIEFEVGEDVFFVAVVPEGADYLDNKTCEHRRPGSHVIKRAPVLSNLPAYVPPKTPKLVDDVAKRAGAAMARAAKQAVNPD
jgi:hypothetical protein